MKMPGFTAEASLYENGESHIMNEMLVALINDREIIPQATRDCYDFNGHIICLPRAYKPWWRRWPDPEPWREGMPDPTPWREELSGTAISMQEMISI
jgi:hypothetical protein